MKISQKPERHSQDKPPYYLLIKVQGVGFEPMAFLSRKKRQLKKGFCSRRVLSFFFQSFHFTFEIFLTVLREYTYI